MPTHYCTLTALDIQVEAEMLIQKHLRHQDYGPKCRTTRLWTILLIRRGTHLLAGRRLRRPGQRPLRHRGPRCAARRPARL